MLQDWVDKCGLGLYAYPPPWKQRRDFQDHNGLSKPILSGEDIKTGDCLQHNKSSSGKELEDETSAPRHIKNRLSLQI